LTRSTAFFINGGAGRVITSIPAFELFEKENPEDDFIIVCEGGTDFYKGHPTLHKRVFDNWHKGLFEEKLKDRNCETPEPYRVWEYYNQKCSLAQAFDIAINKKGLREVGDPKIVLNKQEMISGANLVDEVRKVSGKEKVLVVQPFGRTTESVGDFIIDNTSRSFQLTNIVDIINILKKEYGIIIMSEIPVPLEEADVESKYPVAQPDIRDIRVWAGVIECADHFLGCDSLGQHIVKALGKTATVVTGSTYPINISYINDPKFDIIDIGEGKRVYSPIRLTMEEEQDRHNDEVMEMTTAQIEQVCNSVRKVLGKTVKKQTFTQAPQQKLQAGASNLNKPFGDKK
jgi:hypothetical protein